MKEETKSAVKDRGINGGSRISQGFVESLGIREAQDAGVPRSTSLAEDQRGETSDL